MIFLEIPEKVVSSKDLSYFYQLISIALSHEKWFFLEKLDKVNTTIEANMAPVDQMSSE